MRIKTSELTGPALDWAVAMCEGVPFESYCAAVAWMKRREVSDDELGAQHAYQYSTGWAQGGPIIEQEEIGLWYGAGPLSNQWGANKQGIPFEHYYGPTPLIAAMRCRVASTLGAEVDVPGEVK